jgi:hypothetical protein
LLEARTLGTVPAGSGVVTTPRFPEDAAGLR